MEHGIFLIFSSITAEFCSNASYSLCWCDQNSFLFFFMKIFLYDAQLFKNVEVDEKIRTDVMRIRDITFSKFYFLI